MPPAARLNLVRLLLGTEGEVRSGADAGGTTFEDALLSSRSTTPFAAGATGVVLADLFGTLGGADFNTAVFDVVLNGFCFCLAAVVMHRRELTV